MTRTAFTLTSVAMLALSGCSEPAPDARNDASAQAESEQGPAIEPISAAESIDAGLAVGDGVPLETSLLVDGRETNFGEILEKGPALVVFTRSVEWCPYCQTQLKSINAIADDLKRRGYTLYGLSYDSPGQQERFAKNQMLQYEMLSDQSSAVIDGFGLRDPQYTEGRAVGVPYASVYLIDGNGTIIAKTVSGDYKKRPSNEQILALVDSI
ncbi:peroxiredoxin family protein [Sphingorhabdus sp. SMR4y]|uniref:peroxiredoxin family protein n=1 Tax=Sphingorhabdus sp. SMR4y TaxID=2584094 RepID=UPI000B61A0E9|nr:peroxiredoxin family protein [Sphingorhabdus sp. SMR4y]ASK87481.1 putative peroxiredoxin bcp [Sphingorhabdus sp. SMR4y]